MTEQMLMKNALGPAAVSRIALSLTKVWPKFNTQAFSKSALQGLEALELKQRVDHLIDALAEHLPTDFIETAAILKRLPEHWDFGDPKDSTRSFASWPVIDYAARCGLEHPEVALDLLKNITHLGTAEFAIRPFILRYPELCIAELKKWAQNDSEHIRRLASEGSRPRLPWGIRLQTYCKDPSPLLPILESLNQDTSDYVARSVANSINDISKDNPDIALSLCSQWMTNSPSQKTQWIVRHGMRTLIKQGRAEVFPLLGFTKSPKVQIDALQLKSNQIALGGALQFETTLISQSKKHQRLAIDFAIHHRKANGSLSAKVFKWKEIDLKPGERRAIGKKHPIKKITTRRYYPGQHQLDLIVNGRLVSSLHFTLSC